MPNVYIEPSPAQHPNEGGIRRVTEALVKYLPEHGWDVTSDPAEADVINTHGVHLLEGYPDTPVVQSSHGLMWSDYFGHNWDVVNAQLVRALKRADAITAPSQWVARAIARGMACNPVVIHHGVDADEWKPMPTQGYALWNKARYDEVSDVRDVMKLAALMPDVPFVSTLGTATANLKICGVVPLSQMKPIIAQAGVYLALPRETFGIGTLEAMACGVPVAGWDYGGQREIIRQGETGYLAPYGDYARLADCVRRCLAERGRLAVACRADVVQRWQWLPRIAQYAALFDAALGNSVSEPKVSVIVTSYNLGRFLPDALKSVVTQSWKDWECIVVDDCSTDNTAQVAKQWAANGFAMRYVRPPKNLGLPAARNFGMAHARGKYVIPLDADDMLAPNALETLSKALDSDKDLHIAYGHLDVCNEEATQRQRSGWPVHGFDYAGQLKHDNQLHYSAMMRRSIWERTQGYRRRSWQAEDAEFWGYATSFGFNAQRVTADSTLIYRMRSGSKSSTNDKMGTQWNDGDWSGWYTWKDKPENTPFGAQGNPPAGVGRFWPVPHHADPQVSVIIPVGPAHVELLQDALDSVMAQTFTDWEVIVVNDTGMPLDQRGYSFAQWIDSAGGHGPGYCRNRGVEVARGELLVFLDADDYLQPAFLESVISAYRAEGKPSLIYTDWFKEDGRGAGDIWHTTDWDWHALKDGMINCVTCLVPKDAHDAIGGFNEELRGWEDYDYMLRLAEAGLCGKRIPQPLMTYRYQSGLRREASYAEGMTLKPQIVGPFRDYFEGRKEMACSSCGGGRAKALPPVLPQGNGNANVQMRAATVPGQPQEGMILIEYMGDSQNSIRYVGKPSETAYRFSDTPEHKLKYVYAIDVPYFLTLGVPGRPGVQLFRRADEAQPASPSRPLVVRDRPAPVNPPPAVAPPVAVQTVQGMPAALPPEALPLPPKGAEVVPVRKPDWQIAAERKEAQRTGIAPAQAPMAAPVPEAPMVVDVQPMAASDFAPPPHAVEVAPKPAPASIEKPLLDRPYAEIRNAVPSLSLTDASRLLSDEQAGRKRQGVVRLLQAHIEAVRKDAVHA